MLKIISNKIKIFKRNNKQTYEKEIVKYLQTKKRKNYPLPNL